MPKEHLTASVDPALKRRLDRELANRVGPGGRRLSRSEAVEEALRLWLKSKEEADGDLSGEREAERLGRGLEAVYEAVVALGEEVEAVRGEVGAARSEVLAGVSRGRDQLGGLAYQAQLKAEMALQLLWLVGERPEGVDRERLRSRAGQIIGRESEERRSRARRAAEDGRGG